MKSAEARDAMVARVKEAHKKYPNFEDLPATASGNISFPVSGNGESDYMQALYGVCARGEVIGRNKNFVMGRIIRDAPDEVQPQGEVKMKIGKKGE